MKQNMLTYEQICSFCLALHHLLHAGIPLGDSLVLLAEDEQDAALQQTIKDMACRADEGAGLAQILRESQVFPGYVCTLVQVGEQVGRVEQTLWELAGYYERRARLEQKLRTALLYPAMLMVVLLAVAVILLVWVLPVFNDVYAQLGSSLTGFAGWLLALGGVLRAGFPVICLVIAAVAAALAVPAARKYIKDLWLRYAGDRGVERKLHSARFMQALAVALRSGMTAQQGLDMAKTLSQGEAQAFCDRCQSCVVAIESGIGLPQALQDNDFLQAADRRLLDAGIRSGKSEDVLQDIARRMLEESEQALERRSGYAEPVLVAVACVLIGTVLLSVLLPLMQIMTAIG